MLESMIMCENKRRAVEIFMTNHHPQISWLDLHCDESRGYVVLNVPPSVDDSDVDLGDYSVIDHCQGRRPTERPCDMLIVAFPIRYRS